MKNIKINLFALSLAMGSFLMTSCNEDDAKGDSVLETAYNVSGTIVTDFDSSAALTVNEADNETFTYTVTIDRPQAVDIHVKVSKVSGSATVGDDIEFDEDIVIPANSLTATGSITILDDLTPESLEDITLQIGDVTTSNAVVPAKNVTFNIVNNLSDSLDLTFNFNKSFSIAGTAYSIYGIQYDMDFYIFDASGNDTGIYDAATANMPEHVTITNGDLPDGVYTVYYDIYDDGGISGVYHDPFDIPITVDYIRGGGIAAGTFAQESDFAPNSTDGSGSDFVMSFELSGGVFILRDSQDNVIASGKSAVNSKIKAAINAARAKKRK